MIRTIVSVTTLTALMFAITAEVIAAEAPPPDEIGAQHYGFSRGSGSGAHIDSLLDNYGRGAIIPGFAWVGPYAWGGPVGYPSQFDPGTTGFFPDYYTVWSEAELLLSQAGTYQFRDGNDDVTRIVIDGTPIIDDNSWTSFNGAGNGGGGQGSYTTLSAGQRYYIEFTMSEGGGGDAASFYWDFDPVTNTTGANPDFTNTPDPLGIGALVPAEYMNPLDDPVVVTWLGRSTWQSQPTDFGFGGRQLNASVRTQTADSAHDVRGFVNANNWGNDGGELREVWFNTPRGAAASAGDTPVYDFTVSDNAANNGLDHSLSVNFANTGEGDLSYVNLGREELGIAEEGTSATFEIRSFDGSPLTGTATLNLGISASFDFNFTSPGDYVKNPEFPRDVNSAEAGFTHRWLFDSDVDNDGVPDNEFFPISFGGPYVEIRDGFDEWVPFWGVTRNVVAHSSVETTGGNTVVNAGYDFAEDAPFDLDLSAIDGDGDGVGYFNIIGNFLAHQSISNGLDPSRAGPSGDTESTFVGGGDWSFAVTSDDSAYDIILFDGNNGGGGDPPPPPVPDPVPFAEPYLLTTDGKRLTTSELVGTINATVEDGSKGDGVVSASIIKLGGVCYAANEIPFLNAQTGEVPGDDVSFPNLTMITAHGPDKATAARTETKPGRRDGAIWALVTAAKPKATMQDVLNAANAEALQLGEVTVKGEKLDLTETPQASGDLTRTLGGQSSTHLFVYAGVPEAPNVKHFDIILDNWARSGEAGPNTTITALWGNSTQNQVINGIPVEVLPATLENVAKTWNKIGDLVDDGLDEQIIIFQLDHADVANNVENPPAVPGADAAGPGLQKYSIDIPNERFSTAMVSALQEGKPFPDEVAFDIITAQPLSELNLDQVSVAINDGFGFQDLGTLDTALAEPFVLPDGQAANRFEFGVSWPFLNLPDFDAPLDSVTEQTLQITNGGPNELVIDRIGLALGPVALINIDELLPPGDGQLSATLVPILGLTAEEGRTMEADVVGESGVADAIHFEFTLDLVGQAPQDGKVVLVLGDGEGTLAGVAFEDGEGLIDSFADPAFDAKSSEKDENGDKLTATITGDVGLVLSVGDDGVISFDVAADGLVIEDFQDINVTMAIPFKSADLNKSPLKSLLTVNQVGEGDLAAFLKEQGVRLKGDEFDGVVLSGSLVLSDTFSSVAVPEPASVLMLAVWLFCWVAARIRRRLLVVA